ncbi:MAG: HAD family hydrolase [Bdellovibrionales bacterium]
MTAGPEHEYRPKDRNWQAGVSDGRKTGYRDVPQIPQGVRKRGSMDTRHPLIEVAEQVREQSRAFTVAVIFDLDSTLFCVSPRTQHILRQLGHDREFSDQHAEAAEILRHIEVLPTDWGVRQALERTRLKPTPELAHLIRNYWRRHFFSSHLLDKDHIYPSANEYVRHLHDLGADILYLTGRNEAHMKAGTLRALMHWGFPFYAESKLIMKPNEIETDESFKAHVLKRLVQSYDHIWFFENEPVIIDQVRSLVPQVHIVFVNSVHSGQGVAPEDLRTIAPSYSAGLTSGSPQQKPRSSK